MRDAMRISVVGTSGSGKSTLARKIAGALDIPFIELDAINWQPGWRDLNTHDPGEFRRRVEVATQAQSWVVDGNYGTAVGAIIRARATHLVWLDYDRRIIMARVIRRSFTRGFTGRELWPGTGNREHWQNWFRPSHPIRWAWSTWESRRLQYASMLANGAMPNLTVVRLRHPRDAPQLVESLRQSSLS